MSYTNGPARKADGGQCADRVKATGKKKRKRITQHYDRPNGETICLSAFRLNQTLQAMIERKERGVSSLTHPGLRLSHYVMCLRRLGLPITMTETPQPSGFGWYGVYHLRENVTLRDDPPPRQKQRNPAQAKGGASNIQNITASDVATHTEKDAPAQDGSAQ